MDRKNFPEDFGAGVVNLNPTEASFLGFSVFLVLLFLLVSKKSFSKSDEKKSSVSELGLKGIFEGAGIVTEKHERKTINIKPD